MFISIVVILSIILLIIKFLTAHNSYEKILCSYLIFLALSIIILVNAVANLSEILDLILILFLFKLVAILFLLFNRKKI